MEKTTILTQIQEIFRDILDDDTLVLQFETTAQDIEEWDSLTHIQLIVSIEKHFKIKFSSKEILSWKNIDEIVETTKVKLG